MKQTNTEDKNTRFWTKARQTFLMTTALIMIFIGFGSRASAQFTFMGDYDKLFAAPLGYYIDPQNPDPTIDENATAFYTGDYASDGSIIAGGNLQTTSDTVDFYVRKFTPAGAVDSAFGTNGFVRTNFYAGVAGSQIVFSYDEAQVLKVQPDGKILLAGQCNIHSPEGIPYFGTDACLVRYNPNGSIDSGFGNVSLLVGGGLGPGGAQNQTFSFPVGEGRFMTQTGVIQAPGNPGPRQGTNGRFYDMAIQPDGKIILVGVTRNAYNNGAFAQVAFLMRLNQNGTLDSSFGTNGIVQMAANSVGPNCYPNTGFFGVRLQADGRIIALGYDSVVNNTDCSTGGNFGNRFLVTRWTANGQAEALRHLDNNTTFNGQRERATTAFFTRDGSKIIVSGSYDCKATLVRLNVADLSVDTSFSTNGIRGYAQSCGTSTSPFGTTLYVKAIQPDGRIIGSDDANVFNSNGVVRFNPDGSSDQSFGNVPFEGNNPALRGRLRIDVPPAGNSPMQNNAHVLVRPNGRINLIGYAPAFFTFRGVVSQQNTTFENGICSDFTNDGKTDVGVFRPSSGAWFYLNSSNNQSNGIAFGLGTDKIAPADYDGDGRADVAVFRDGIWYLQQSTKGFTGISFGTAGDLPRPGDFDGDGLADISVFRPSTGIWYRLNSSNGQLVGIWFGQSGDVPLLADFDADGKTDIAVFRQGLWYYLQSSDGQFRAVQFGASTDVPTVGDYDGDSRADVAVFRESNGTWYRIDSSTGAFVFNQFGQTGDKPVPGDYDGDGKNDLAIFRSGTWYGLRSNDNSVFGLAYGAATDVPVPAAYLP